MIGRMNVCGDDRSMVVNVVAILDELLLLTPEMTFVVVLGDDVATEVTAIRLIYR